MKNAILEIGVEHLPSRFVAPALEQMSKRAESLLKEERLRFEKITVCGTLRRLTLILEGLQDKSDPLEKTATGPSAKMWKDSEGRLTPQAIGFAKSQGVSPEELKIVSGPKGEVLQATRAVPGMPSGKVLARVFPALIQSLQFPKNMEWEESRMRFARPIRNLLALNGKQVVPFTLAGVRSSNKAYGASIGAKPIKIDAPEKYIQKMRNYCILVHAEDRKSCLIKSMEPAVRKTKSKPDLEGSLLDEIVYLTEYPVPVVGGFQKEFLALPQGLLTTVLKKQLKFFPVLNDQGRLEPFFVGVRDGASEGQKEVQEGYERVLEARFNDASFFYQRDRQSTLESKNEKLRPVTFQQGLGSLFDKSLRVEALAQWIGEHLADKGLRLDVESSKRIARLAYSDLVTEVVKEFPELQGVMGGHYARQDCEPERIALGVEEFYFPLGAKTPLPTTLEGSVAALAGKVDTVAALFYAGHIPTGSEDPLGLRRLAAGIIRIVIEKQLDLDLSACLSQALSNVLVDIERDAKQGPPSRQKPKEDILQDILKFLWQRMETLFQDRFPLDEIQSVSDHGLKDLRLTVKRLVAVHSLRSNEDFNTLAGSFKRISNILKQAKAAEGDNPSANMALMSLDAEKDLFEALGRVESSVRDLILREEFEPALKELLVLKPLVDRFFETVRVMDAEESIKRNRLALLSHLARLFKSVANISALQ